MRWSTAVAGGSQRFQCADRASSVRIRPKVCRFRTPHAQSRARSPGALHFTLGQRKMMGNQPLRHRDFRSARTELGPYAAGHAKLPLTYPVVTDRNPLGSRRADGLRLWWPRCAKARMGDVFCCTDSTLGPTQSKDRGVPKNSGSWRETGGREWSQIGPGRPGWLPTQAPHRSGLAHHAHPVPHLMTSLRCATGCGPLAVWVSRNVAPVEGSPTRGSRHRGGAARASVARSFLLPPGTPGDWGSYR